MRHLRAFRKFGMDSDVRRKMFRNLTTQLIRYGKIKTTLCRAKDLRRFADKMVHYAFRGTETARQKAAAFLYDSSVCKKLMTEMPNRFKGLPAGYTRIVRLGQRKGDRAEMCYIGFIDVLPSRKTLEQAQKKVRDEAAAQTALV